LEDERRKLQEPALRQLSAMDRLGDVRRRREAEVCGDPRLEQRARATPVFTPSCDVERLDAEIASTAPVTADRPERREPRFTAVARETDTVDSRAAGDRDPPAGVRPRPEHREGVVSNAGAPRPAATRSSRLCRFLLVG